MKTIIVASIILLTGCAVSTAPDGTVTRAPDYNAWLEIVRLIKTDEVPVAPIVPSK